MIRLLSLPEQQEDIAASLRISIEQIRCRHPIQGYLPGIDSDAQPCIVECIGDIPEGTNRRMIISEVIYYHPGPASMERPTTRVRKVHAIRHVLERIEVFHIARVGKYCASTGNACLLFHNNEPWMLQHPQMHEISHGDVLTIHVPPSSDHEDTCDAVHHTEAQAMEDPEAYQSDIERFINHSSSSDEQALQYPQEEIGDTEIQEEECENCRMLAVWYIDHSHFRLCAEPRVVRVCGQQESWRDAIFSVWSDQMSRTAPFRLAIAHPQPASLDYSVAEYHVELLHVILEQHTVFSSSAILLAYPGAFHHSTRDRIVALSTSTLTCSQLIIRHARSRMNAVAYPVG